MPALIIFVVLVVLIMLAALGWALQVIEDAMATVADFVTGMPVGVLIAVAVLVVAIAAVVAVRNDSLWAFIATVIGICLVAAVPILVVPPLVHGRQWNHDPKCMNDGDRHECDSGNRCIGGGDERDPWGFCAAPFGGDFIGLAEFTQGQFRMYARRQFHAECDRIKAKGGWDWTDKVRCEGAIDDRVGELFDRTVGPENCRYFDLAGRRKTPLLIDDDAPMPCVSRDQAARVCADLGGRLPTVQDYRSIFDDREPSCENAVMSGAPEYKGLARHIKAREMRRFKAGPGCGRGRFSKVCDKYRTGNTPDGLCDVFGNLAEWTSDGGAMGGGFRSTAGEMRDEIPGSGPRIDVGFRCVITGEHLTDPIDRF